VETLIPVNIKLPSPTTNKERNLCVREIILCLSSVVAATAPLSFSDHPHNNTTANLVLPPNKQPMNYSSVNRCNKQPMGDNVNEMFCLKQNLHNYSVWGLILRQIMWKINIIIVSGFQKQQINFREL
jgi:hypothetical protein